MNTEIAIYQAENGALELRGDIQNETLWANQKQISEIFGIERSVVTKHIKNIFADDEVDKNTTCAFFAQVQKEGGREVSRNIEFYSLDIILAVGYRTNSLKAITFRKWATQILKQHITEGYTINTASFEKNKTLFLKALEEVKTLTSGKTQVTSDNILDLVQTFAHTWFSLESYDKQSLPDKGTLKSRIDVNEEELYKDIRVFKSELMEKGEATHLFAEEKNNRTLGGILGNVMQSAFGEDLYPFIEEKAAHLLYFIIKNHPFNDGNKRTGAFSFLWFLKQARYHFQEKITPATLTTLTLLIAESDPKEKDKMVGLVLLLLQSE